MPKYIFVTGGVISGIGKGITAASLGRLLKARGLKVTSQKLDPYINVDPGAMNPIQHGEVFVTDDGAETDLDLGHYERFIDENLNKYSYCTSGKIYWSVLNKERNGEYEGTTVQVIPHITNEIKNYIYNCGIKSNADVLITEIGGTVGDIESQPFIEAIRQISREEGRGNCLFIHVSLVPYVKMTQEHKTKPTQHSVKQMQTQGIAPDIIVARLDEPAEPDIYRKIALFCNVKPDYVIENCNVPVLYEIPLELEKQHFSGIVCKELGLETPEPDMTEWKEMLSRLYNCHRSVRIALVGKFVKLHDSYLSAAEALKHAGFENASHVEIKWIDSETLNAENIAAELEGCDGLLIPGGFGDNAIEGMTAAIHYARVHKMPYLGLCAGMQASVVEFLRNVCGIVKANSVEVDPNTEDPCVIYPENKREAPEGKFLRLGSYPCMVKPNTKLMSAYGASLIAERHRNSLEINSAYFDALQDYGMVLSGLSPDGRLVEALELPESPFFVAVNYNAELKSRPNRAHPLFRDFIKACLKS